jgi:predicted ATPase
VLDNCEHVIDAAARMAEALLRANPAVQVIATSRRTFGRQLDAAAYRCAARTIAPFFRRGRHLADPR